jgi:hypothetical protein
MRDSNLTPAFVTVPKGAVIEISREVYEPWLVQITMDNQPLLAFMRDLRELAEPINVSTALDGKLGYLKRVAGAGR